MAEESGRVGVVNTQGSLTLIDVRVFINTPTTVTVSLSNNLPSLLRASRVSVEA